MPSFPVVNVVGNPCSSTLPPRMSRLAIEMLEDLIMAATNEALRKVEDEAAKAMGKLAGGLGSMGGGFPF